MEFGGRQSCWDVWPGAQRGVAVGIPPVPAGAGQRLPRSVVWTPAPALGSMCFHPLLRPATQFYSLTRPLWPASSDVAALGSGYDFLSISFGSCFIFFLCRCGRSRGRGDE